MTETVLIIGTTKQSEIYIDGKFKFSSTASVGYTVREYQEENPTAYLVKDIEFEYFSKYKFFVKKGDYLIGIQLDDSLITLTAFIRVKGNWVCSHINNLDAIEELWDSLWKADYLRELWFNHNKIRVGRCDWDIQDTPITLDKVVAALIKYDADKLIKAFNSERREDEWETIVE